jgi:hypothetical protein
MIALGFAVDPALAQLEGELLRLRPVQEQEIRNGFDALQLRRDFKPIRIMTMVPMPPVASPAILNI